MNKKKLAIICGISAIVLTLSIIGCSAATAAGTTDVAGGTSLSVSNQQTGIWVNGEGKVSVTPDIATITLGIEAQDTTVAGAQAQAAPAMDAVMKVLKDAGYEGVLAVELDCLREDWEEDQAVEVSVNYLREQDIGL